MSDRQKKWDWGPWVAQRKEMKEGAGSPPTHELTWFRRNLCAKDRYKQFPTQCRKPGLDQSVRGGFLGR